MNTHPYIAEQLIEIRHDEWLARAERRRLARRPARPPKS
jgi:hypothetical protein